MNDNNFTDHRQITLLHPKVTPINLLLSVIILSFASVAPIEWFDENGLVETGGNFYCYLPPLFAGASIVNSKPYLLFLTCGLILFLIFGRELSWGRVFFYTDTGEIIKRSDWFMGDYIYYFVGAYVIAGTAYAIKTKFAQQTLMLIKHAPIIVIDFALVFLMIAISLFADKKVLPEAIYHLAMPIEESAEFALYFILFMLLSNYAKLGLLASTAHRVSEYQRLHTSNLKWNKPSATEPSATESRFFH